MDTYFNIPRFYQSPYICLKLQILIKRRTNNF